MAINAADVTLDESATIDKRLLTVTRVSGGFTRHSETFVLIDPDDATDTSIARILNAISAERTSK